MFQLLEAHKFCYVLFPPLIQQKLVVNKIIDELLYKATVTKMQKQNLNINAEQQIFLCQFMTEHNDLAKGILKTAQGRATGNNLWIKLTDKLNQMGPPIKLKLEWKKTWSDLKYKTKSKLIFNKKSKSKTGGGPYQEKILSEIDESIIQSAGLEAAVSGVAKAKTFGCPKEASENERNITNVCINNNSEIIGPEIGATEISRTEISGTEISGTEISGTEISGTKNTNGNKRKNKKEETEKKGEYMERYTRATEEINRNLKRLLETNKENQKLLKRQNETQEKIYKIKKQKMEEDKARGREKLLLKKESLQAKIEENKLRRLEFESR